MTSLPQALSLLGLTEKEARTYLALLTLGKSTAYAVAKASGLKRPTTYLLLETLLQKGIVLKFPAQKQLYIAKSPIELIQTQETQLALMREVLPQLMALGTAKEGSKFLYFEGLEGIEEALAYRREESFEKELLCFYGLSQKPLKGKTLDVFLSHNRTLAEQHTRVRGFAPNDKSLKLFRNIEEKYPRSIITLPLQQFSAQVSVEIYPNLTKIFFHLQQQAMIIENQSFTEFLRQLFELLWASKMK